MPEAPRSDDPVVTGDGSTNRWASWIKSLLRTGLFAYAAVLILLVTLESRLVYPGAYMDIPSGDAVGVTRVTYPSSDSVELSGRLFQYSKAAEGREAEGREAEGRESEGRESEGGDAGFEDRPIVLYFHGNGTTAAHESSFIARLGKQLGANVLAAEYRGFDGLGGAPCEAGVIADSLAARDFLCQHYDIEPSRLILYGQSLGGGCATAVAADSGATLLVLDRTFDRMVDVAAGRYWFLPVRMLMRNRYDSVSRLQKYSGPLLQFHGTADTLIPIAHARRLYESAPSETKRMIEVPGMGHNDAMPPEEWAEGLAQMKEWIHSDR